MSTRGYGSTHQFCTHCHLIRLEESLLSGVVTSAKHQQWKYADGCWCAFAFWHEGNEVQVGTVQGEKVTCAVFDAEL